MFHLMLKSLDFQSEQASTGSPRLPLALEKIILRANVSNPEALPHLFLALQVIPGQTPKTNYAKRPHPGFKLKKDQPLGLQLTLRRDNMGFFLKNFIFMILPKFVDFNGVSVQNMDSHGNLHFGSTQFFLWPQCEVSYEVFRKPSGFHISLILKGDPQKKSLVYSYIGLPVDHDKKI